MISLAHLLPAALVASAVALAGCGAGDEPVGGVESTSAVTTAAAPAPASGPTSTPAADPSFDPPIPPGTPVARGPQVRLGGLTATLPTGYEVLTRSSALVTSHTPGAIHYLTLQTIASGALTQTTTATAEEEIHASGYLRRPERQPDVVVDGVPMYHLEGPISSSEDAEVYGAQSTGYNILIELKWETGTALAERRATTQSLLATMRVRR